MSAAHIARALGGHRAGGGWLCRCPVPGHGKGRGDRSPSLQIRDGDSQLLVRCHAGCEPQAVLDELRRRGLVPTPAGRGDYLPRRAPQPRRIDENAAADRARMVEAALRIWKASQPAAGTLVEAYLRSRAITLPPPPTIRFHSSLRHKPTGLRLPAMVAAVQASDRRVVGIHRTFLALNGHGKADVTDPKMSLGDLRGGAVRLAAIGEELAIAEGIETGLSIMEAIGVPVWAALSSGNLHVLALPPLPLAAMVTICADPDKAGLAAAEHAAERWYREGRRVRIAVPPPGSDLNDVIRAPAGEGVSS